MSDFITFFIGEEGVSTSTFWDNLISLVPFILILIPVSFGIHFIRRLFKMRYCKLDI